MYSDVSLLTCSLQVHLRQVFGEFTGAGPCFPLPCDVGHCVPAACAIAVDEVRVRRLHVHHLSMTSALITPAGGRRGMSDSSAEVLQEANKSPCCFASVVCGDPWEDALLCPVHFFFSRNNVTHRNKKEKEEKKSQYAGIFKRETGDTSEAFKQRG